ncbi:MAG: EAL domain-containing protein [Turneriella sp.]
MSPLPAHHSTTQQEHYDDTDLRRQYLHPEDRPLLARALENAPKEPFLLRWYRKDGRLIYLEHTLVEIHDAQGKLTGLAGIGRDVTEAQQAKQDLELLNHAYTVLWQINRLVVREKNPESIFSEACQIPLSSGNFSLAWVGRIDRANNAVTIAATAGEKKHLEYLQQMHITLDDTPTGRGPTGMAARFGSAFCSSDIAGDSTMMPWRDRALAHGFRSSAAFPLKLDGEVIAVWTLYSPVQNYFSRQIQSLYSQLAGDISFALGVANTEAQKIRLAKELEISIERWRFALEATGDGLWDWNLEKGEIFFSPTLPTMLGYTPEEWGNSLSAWQKRVHSEDQERVLTEIEKHFTGKSSLYACEYRLLCKDGSYKWILDRGKVIERNAAGKAKRMIGLHTDISEQKVLREQALEREESLATLFSESPLGIAVVDLDTSAILNANPKFCEILGRPLAAVLKLHWQDFTHTDDIVANLKLVEEIRTGRRKSFTVRKRYVRPDGSVVWGNLTLSHLTHYHENHRVNIAIIEDVTEMVHHEERMRLDSAVISNTRDGVVITDLVPRIVSVNRAYTEITGYTEEEVLGQNPSILRSGRQDKHFYREMWKEITTTGRWQGELYNRRKNGEIYPQVSSIDTIYDAQGKPQYYVGVFSDMAKLKKTEESFERLAHYDILTGLPNRLMINNRLNHAIDTAKRRTHSIAVLFMDLDHFKNVNDSLGHVAGDELLAHVAERLRRRLRAEDTMARLGGDEFLILLEDLEGPNGAATVARDIISTFSAPFRLTTGHDVYSACSIGISLFPQDGETSADLIQNADAALYLSKSEGRNTFRFYTNDLTAAARRRLDLESLLRRAISQNELSVHYQPIVQIDTGEVVGAEALCRWITDGDATVSPAEFIPVAEETGLIIQLGDFVLQTACRDAALFHGHNARFKTMAVNASVRQFQGAEWFGHIESALADKALPAGLLEIEITESTIMNKGSEAVAILQRLREIGIRVAIDDFGTGYSSLSYLQQFAVNQLKIDQSFVREMTKNPASAQLVRTMIAMAKNLGLTTLAEGVENVEQVEILRAEGCTYYQGYLKSPAVPADKFLKDFL